MKKFMMWVLIAVCIVPLSATDLFDAIVTGNLANVTHAIEEGAPVDAVDSRD